jgi:hypothetical protein
VRNDKKRSIVPLERLVSRIFLVRGQKVMLDADLARLYGVTTKRLNEQVRRNIDRFPPDFMFDERQGTWFFEVATCDLKGAPRSWRQTLFAMSRLVQLERCTT